MELARLTLLADGRIQASKALLAECTEYRGYYYRLTELAYSVYDRDGIYQGSHYTPELKIDGWILEGVTS